MDESSDEEIRRLHTLRKDPYHSEALLEFARKRHVEEGVHFLATVETFDEQVKVGVLELASIALTSLDLSPSARQNVKDAVSEEKLSLKIFIPLKNEITAFLINNILPKFVEEELSDFKAQVNQLNKVLRNQKTRKKFITATRKAGAGHDIDFWIQLDTITERTAELAYAIWDTYISQGTDSQINISAQMVDDIQQTLLQFPDINIFSEAYKHVAYLLATDVVPDYLDTIASPRLKVEAPEPLMSRTGVLQRKPVLPRTKSFEAKNGKSLLKEAKKDKNSQTLSASMRRKQQVQDRVLPEEFIVRTKPKSQIQKDLSKATQPKSTSKAQKLLGEECTIVLEKMDGSIPVIGAPPLAPSMASQPAHVKLTKLNKMFGEVVPIHKIEDTENSEDSDEERKERKLKTTEMNSRKSKLAKLLGEEVPESLIRRKPISVLPEMRNLENPGTLCENPMEDYLLVLEKGMVHLENFFDQRIDVIGKLMMEEQERQVRDMKFFKKLFSCFGKTK